MSYEYYDQCDWVGGLFWGLVLGIIIVAATFMIFYGIDPKVLSQQTLDDVCHNLTNNSASSGDVNPEGKLICTSPSYDHTQNIIMKKAGEQSP